MAVSLTHATVAAGTNNGNGEIAKEQWNEAHTLSMASQRVLGRTTSGTGAAEELKGMWVEVSRASPSSSASVEFTGIDSTADEWAVAYYNVLPATDGDQLMMYTSTNGGSSYDTGASDYSWTYVGHDGTTTNSADQTSDLIPVNGYFLTGNVAGEGASGNVILYTPSAAAPCRIRFEYSVISSSTLNKLFTGFGHAQRLASADVDAIKFAFFTGNIASGTFALLKRLK